MTRRIFNFTAATSLLLCLATMALWVQTVWVTKFNDNSRFEEGVQMLCGWIGVGQGRIIATTFPHSLHFEFEDHRIYGDGPRFEVIENPYAAIHSHDQFRSPVSIRRSTLEWGGVRYFFLGFAFSPYHLERYSDGQICRKTVIEIPLWLPILVTAALPVWRLRQFLKNRQRGGFSLCVRCSYDLTGNMSGICPECGVPVGGRVATT